MKPYQKYSTQIILELNGYKNAIKEVCEAIKELSESPVDNLHQLIFFMGVLRYLKYDYPLTNK